MKRKTHKFDFKSTSDDRSGDKPGTWHENCLLVSAGSEGMDPVVDANQVS